MPVNSQPTDDARIAAGLLADDVPKGPLGQGTVAATPVPWVSASEMLPDCQDEQSAVDDVDEASMESFPCSDPPSHHGTCHI